MFFEYSRAVVIYFHLTGASHARAFKPQGKAADPRA
jgi:hypothetical protein